MDNNNYDHDKFQHNDHDNGITWNLNVRNAVRNSPREKLDIWVLGTVVPINVIRFLILNVFALIVNLVFQFLWRKQHNVGSHSQSDRYL